MYNVFCFVPVANVICSDKVKNEIKNENSDHSQHGVGFILCFRVYNHNFYSIFMN